MNSIPGVLETLERLSQRLNELERILVAIQDLLNRGEEEVVRG